MIYYSLFFFLTKLFKVCAQQRMIIQSLETGARQYATRVEKHSEILLQERDVLTEEYSNKQVKNFSPFNLLAFDLHLFIIF